jgi:RNA polymerase primary sigma factor
VIDNEEAASKVTVVKKKTRLSTATEAAQADVPVADASDVAEAPVKVVKVARKTLRQKRMRRPWWSRLRRSPSWSRPR